MIRNLNEETALKFKTLSKEEKESKGILGRLYGKVADFTNGTRNGRKYPLELWTKLFDSDLIKERFNNGGIMGELCHPEYEEINIEKVAIMMPEPPLKDNDGQLVAYVDILDTPCGRVAYQLARYGYKFGISSRGSGDIITDYEGNEIVDPETYTLTAFDLVEIPGVEAARLSLTESLNKTKYNKTLRESLQQTLTEASEDERKVMEDTLHDLDIDLDEQPEEQDADLSDEAIDPAKEARLFDSIQELVNKYREDNGLEDATESDIQNLINLMRNDVMFNDELELDRPEDDELVSIEEPTVDESLIINEDESRFNSYVNKLRTVSGVSQRASILANASTDWMHKNLTDDEFKELCSLTKRNQPEMEDINEDQKLAVDNNEAMVEELQTALQNNATLENRVIELQEQLSVCYTKETAYEGKIAKQQKAISVLTENSNKARVLEEQLSKVKFALSTKTNEVKRLTEQLENNSNELDAAKKHAELLQKRITNLNESVNSGNSKQASLNEEMVSVNKQVDSLKEQLQQSHNRNIKLEKTANMEISKLNESIEGLKKDLQQSKSEYSQKLDKANQLVEKYRGTAQKAVDKYIESQAVRLGADVNEIKNRLPESYNFNDIDTVCENLQSYKRNISKLPFQTALGENLRIKATPSTNEKLRPANSSDDIDDQLLKLAGLK